MSDAFTVGAGHSPYPDLEYAAETTWPKLLQLAEEGVRGIYAVNSNFPRESRTALAAKYAIDVLELKTDIDSGSYRPMIPILRVSQHSPHGSTSW